MMMVMMVMIWKVVQKKENKKVDLNQLIIKNHPKKILKNLDEKNSPKKKSSKRGFKKRNRTFLEVKRIILKVKKITKKTKMEVP